MTEIISKDEKITSDNSQESQKILPSQFKFSLFKLAYTAELAAEYKKQRIKFSAAVIYDVAPFLALIFKSLTDNKINFEDGFLLIVINTPRSFIEENTRIKPAKQIFQKTYIKSWSY